MSQNPNITIDNTNELESHILEEIEQLQKIGLVEEEAFLIAKKRMGNTDMLTQEFSKVNRKTYILNKIKPYINGILLFIAFLSITELFLTVSIYLAKELGTNDANLNSVSIGVLTLITILPIRFIYLLYKNENLNVRIFKSLSLLIIAIIILRITIFFSTILLVNSLNKSSFDSLHISLKLYQIILVIFIFTFSFILTYHSKKEKKVKIAK
ncbi:permease prefix domain 1-containing protein [Aureibaculum conchae]|uniref:permease prefix domain 1-containing protein n=1 Tax=Aureibaculum sp. 2308TA14-22 TaxID=3108392 RepID=UPI0033923C7E